MFVRHTDTFCADEIIKPGLNMMSFIPGNLNGDLEGKKEGNVFVVKLEG